MNLSTYIRKLEAVRDQFGGNVEVVHEHDGVDYVPQIEVIDKYIGDVDHFDVNSIPVVKRVILK